MVSLIKLLSINSCSSENKKYPAINLLKNNNNNDNNDESSSSTTSWKCNQWSDYCWIIIELNDEIIIDNLEIQNDCSAFIEILSSNDSKNFKVLLPVFSSKSPENSKNNEKFKFIKKNFISNTQRRPCKFIKCICSQPYNKNIRYGIASIKIYGQKYINNNNEEGEKRKPLWMKKFKFIDNINNNEYFTTTINNKQNISLKKNTSLTSTASISDERERKKIKTSNDDDDNNDDDLKLLSIEKLNDNKKQSIKRNNLFENVIFVIDKDDDDDFKDSYRKKLKHKAIEMGAKYQKELDKNCTHLITDYKKKNLKQSFKNLIIVNERWIIDSYDQCKRLSCKNYLIIDDEHHCFNDNNNNNNNNNINDNKDLKNCQNKKIKIEKQQQQQNYNKEDDGQHNNNNNKNKKNGKEKQNNNNNNNNNDNKHQQQNDVQRRNNNIKIKMNVDYDSDIIYDLDTEEEQE